MMKEKRLFLRIPTSSSTLAVTFSSGAKDEKKVVSTSIHGECTDKVPTLYSFCEWN
jgi:hypothetical protein